MHAMHLNFWSNFKVHTKIPHDTEASAQNFHRSSECHTAIKDTAVMQQDFKAFLSQVICRPLVLYRPLFFILHFVSVSVWRGLGKIISHAR